MMIIEERTYPIISMGKDCYDVGKDDIDLEEGTGNVRRHKSVDKSAGIGSDAWTKIDVVGVSSFLKTICWSVRPLI